MFFGNDALPTASKSFPATTTFVRTNADADRVSPGYELPDVPPPFDQIWCPDLENSSTKKDFPPATPSTSGVQQQVRLPRRSVGIRLQSIIVEFALPLDFLTYLVQGFLFQTSVFKTNQHLMQWPGHGRHWKKSSFGLPLIPYTEEKSP